MNVSEHVNTSYITKYAFHQPLITSAVREQP